MKNVFLIATVIVLLVSLAAFKKSAAPRLYPEIEAYFKKLEGQAPVNVDAGTLEALRQSISDGNLDHIDDNYIFYSKSDGVSTQAAQVFLQSLSFAQRHRRVVAFSAGNEARVIDKNFITELSRIGYKITETTKDNKPVYEVKYADKAPALILFSKSITDQSLATSNVSSIVLCDTTNAGCSIKTPTTPYFLQLDQLGSTLTQTLDNIAKSIVIITNKRKS